MMSNPWPKPDETSTTTTLKLQRWPPRDESDKDVSMDVGTDDEESLVKQDKTTTTPKLQTWHLRGPV